MATCGEVPGRLSGSAGSEHLHQRICQPCLYDDNLIDATGICVDCQDYLCLKCFDAHKEQQHRVQDREQNMDKQTQAKPEDVCSDSCPVHENEVIQYYCVSHCHLGCKSCINLDHTTCDEIQYIPRVLAEQDNNEDYGRKEIQLKSILSLFMNVFRNAQRNFDEVDKSCVDALRDLQNYKRQMNEVLRTIERELVEKVRTLRIKAEQELAEMRNKYKAAHEELQSSLAKIEILQHTNQNYSSYIEMLRTKAKIRSLEDQTQQAEVDISFRQSPIQFSPNKQLLEILKNPGGFGTVYSVGTLNALSGSDEVSVRSGTDSGSVLSESDDFSVLSHSETMSIFSSDFSIISDPESATIQSWLCTESTLPRSDVGGMVSGPAYGTQTHNDQELNVKSEFDKSGCVLTGMVVLPDNRLVLTDYKTASIKAVNVNTGQVVAQLECASRPWDITSIEKDKVAVTMPYLRKVAFVTVGNYNLRIDRAIAVDGKCLGVNYRNGKLAVSFIEPHKVQIHDIKGRVLCSIAGDTSGDTLLKFPYYLTFGQDDTTLYVSNYRDHNVVCMGVDGKVVALYRDGYLKGPKKVVVDSRGNVYVCSQVSNTVLLISKDCKELQVLLTQADGLDRPKSICLSEEEDKLYVGMWSDYVKVYRTDSYESQ